MFTGAGSAIATHRRFGRIARRVAFAFGVTIALGAPVTAVVEAFRQKSIFLDNAAEVAAQNIGRYVYLREATWRYEGPRLEVLLEVSPVASDPIRYSVSDRDGGVIAAVGPMPAWPRLERVAPIEGASGPVGRVSAQISLIPLYRHAALIALLSAIAGLICFLAMYLLPMRAFDRLLGDLADVQRKLEHQVTETTYAYQELERNHRVAEEGAEELARALRLAEDARAQSALASRTKSEFLANMSHELRTPLNAIIGFSQVMAQQMLGPMGNAKYLEYAGDVEKSGRHLLAIINDILDISKIEAGRFELQKAPLDPTAVLQLCERLVHERAREAGLMLILDSGGSNLPLIEADETKLKQILLNLLSNAIKFTPPGNEVRLGARVEGRSITFTVADQGIGMTPPELAMALEPFRQVDNSLSRRHDGTGLGLPLAKRLTELHGGTFDIASAKDVGTTVHVRLPLGEGESSVGAARAA
ncbi:MAG: hypothetical protein JNL66_08210 [Alphaproteobacteria bacterium]|nr:hypothetical protein [Alphaproteobacteria bacterium]